MAESAATSTLYIRCSGLHSRGELLNDFFYTHRAALGIQDYYSVIGNVLLSSDDQDAESATSTAVANSRTVVAERASSPRLPVDFPVEVVYVQFSRKPYFLVEWRYPTAEEVKKQKGKETESSGTVSEGDDKGSPKAKQSDVSSSAERLSADFLAELTTRTLALGKKTDNKPTGELMWRDQPVTISTALAGMTVAVERKKLELRDTQLKTQRVAEKRARDEAESTRVSGDKPASSGKTAASFVPRSVRRHA